MRICDFCKDMERAKAGQVVKERQIGNDKWDACDDCWHQVEVKIVLYVRKMASVEILGISGALCSNRHEA